MIDEKVEEMKEHGDGVLNWKVDDLAAQLTLIAHSLFQELQPCDLKSLKWYNPRMKNQPESVRVNEITRRFNYDGQWAVREILKYQVRSFLLSCLSMERDVTAKIESTRRLRCISL